MPVAQFALHACVYTLLPKKLMLTHEGEINTTVTMFLHWPRNSGERNATNVVATPTISASVNLKKTNKSISSIAKGLHHALTAVQAVI